MSKVNRYAIGAILVGVLGFAAAQVGVQAAVCVTGCNHDITGEYWNGTTPPICRFYSKKLCKDNFKVFPNQGGPCATPSGSPPPGKVYNCPIGHCTNLCEGCTPAHECQHQGINMMCTEIDTYGVLECIPPVAG